MGVEIQTPWQVVHGSTRHVGGDVCDCDDADPVEVSRWVRAGWAKKVEPKPKRPRAQRQPEPEPETEPESPVRHAAVQEPEAKPARRRTRKTEDDE